MFPALFLTLRVLPVGLKEPIGLAYLLARTADTIADTAVVSPERRIEMLLSLRAQVNGEEDEAGLARMESEARAAADRLARACFARVGQADARTPGCAG